MVLVATMESALVKVHHEPKVAIIGAGIAGIAAASWLYRHGLEDITIFEASGRLGGRIRSIKHGW